LEKQQLSNPGVYRAIFKGIIAIGLAHFLTHLLEFALPPLYPLIMEEFSLSYSRVGLLSSSVVITLFIFQTPIGHLSDKKGRKSLILVFLAMLIGSTFLTGLSQNFYHILLFQICVGVGASVYHSAGIAMASDIAPRESIGRFMALQGFGGTFGVALAPFILGFLASTMGWREAIQYIAVFSIPVLLCIWWLLNRPTESQTKGVTERVITSKTVILFILLGFVLQGFVFRSLVSFFPTYMVDVHGSSLKIAGLLTSLLFLGSAFAELIGGEWADRTEKLNVIVISYGIRCVLLYLVNVITHETSLVLLILAFGIVQGLSVPAMSSLILYMSPPDSAGKSYGAIFSIGTITGFFSPIIVGYIADLYDLSFSFSFLIVCLIFAFIFASIARILRFR
jgi:MFS family permease